MLHFRRRPLTEGVAFKGFDTDGLRISSDLRDDIEVFKEKELYGGLVVDDSVREEFATTDTGVYCDAVEDIFEGEAYPMYLSDVDYKDFRYVLSMKDDELTVKMYYDAANDFDLYGFISDYDKYTYYQCEDSWRPEWWDGNEPDPHDFEDEDEYDEALAEYYDYKERLKKLELSGEGDYYVINQNCFTSVLEELCFYLEDDLSKYFVIEEPKVVNGWESDPEKTYIEFVIYDDPDLIDETYND